MAGAAKALRPLWENRETQSLLCPAWAFDPCPPDSSPQETRRHVNMTVAIMVSDGQRGAWTMDLVCASWGRGAKSGLWCWSDSSSVNALLAEDVSIQDPGFVT